MISLYAIERTVSVHIAPIDRTTRVKTLTSSTGKGVEIYFFIFISCTRFRAVIFYSREALSANVTPRWSGRTIKYESNNDAREKFHFFHYTRHPSAQSARPSGFYTINSQKLQWFRRGNRVLLIKTRNYEKRQRAVFMRYVFFARPFRYLPRYTFRGKGRAGSLKATRPAARCDSVEKKKKKRRKINISLFRSGHTGPRRAAAFSSAPPPTTWTVR